MATNTALQVPAATKNRIRTRKGRYAAECVYCECPDGCACYAWGGKCPCGSSKSPTPRQVAAYFRRQEEV